MNRHQVLTGAANCGDRCFTVGSVGGRHFTAYASGCNIVILASDFQRVQIIPGASYGGVEITCISSCSEVGKIAAACRNRVYVFEPTPLLRHESSHKLDYQWYHTATVEVEGDIVVLAWNLEGSRLLTSATLLQLWQMPETDAASRDNVKDVEFFIEDKDHQDQTTWNCIWHCRPSNPVTSAKFSSDGLLFATVGENDRLVKIWFETQKLQLSLMRSDSVSPKSNQLTFGFVYVAHPRAVTGFSWRRMSKYMQKGTIANVLLTSCKDNICRIWCETTLPDDGLFDVQQLDPSAFGGPVLLHSHRNTRRFVQRLQHMRYMLMKRKRPSLVSSQSHSDSCNVNGSSTVHDVHKYGSQTTVAPTIHFHLAASVNPQTDIPLMGPLSNQSSGSNFVIHWLNNKEFFTNLEAEKIIEEMSTKPGTDTCDTGSDVGVTSDLSNSPANSKPGNGLGQLGSDPLLNDVQRKTKLNLQNMKSYVSVDSERSMASAGVSGTASGDRSDSILSLEGKLGQQQSSGLDQQWEARIERLIQDWHQGSDLLFSIHPLDGSFLMWLVEYLDEPYPDSFRQAQVSFSSLLPNAFPTCDALTMEQNLWIYCDYEQIVSRSLQLKSESQVRDSFGVQSKSLSGPSSSKRGSTCCGFGASASHVVMVTKHTNGSLNSWQMTFAEDARFSNVVSIVHESRACGHRFHTNSAACHPVLPLLLTTSHLDTPAYSSLDSGCENLPSSGQPDPLLHDHCNASCGSSEHSEGFCSELILWRVSPIGPLSKSGGIAELARINSPICSAYTNVAWLPTLLPSSSLGSRSNSPSALFIASDGVSLRIYQAVLDGRALLADHETGKQKQSASGSSSLSSGMSSPSKNVSPDDAKGLLKIVSLQSTSRPGCIVELIPIADATQSWKNIQLIHVFQEQLVTGKHLMSSCQSTTGGDTKATADGFCSLSVFEEHFFLVVLERLQDMSTVVHMWMIIVSSQDTAVGINYSHDTIFLQDEEIDNEETQPSLYEESNFQESKMDKDHQEEQVKGTSMPRLFINTFKVCTETLPLPSGVVVTKASVAAGHLSSSSIYPACLAPYIVSTACSDGCVRFWRCESVDGASGDGMTSARRKSFKWKEWEMMMEKDDTSSIYIGGRILAVSCAYSGRIAVAYRSGGVKTRVESPHDQYVNLCVAIYQCESTGGSEWTLEDTVQLRNIVISDPKVDLDLSLIFDADLCVQANLQSPPGSLISPTMMTPAIVRTVPVPSSATVKSVRRHLNAKSGSTVPIHPKHLVHLDWVSTEDGSHILTVGVGSQVLLYAAVSGELASVMAGKATKDDAIVPRPSARGPLQKTKSMAVMTLVPELRWMKLRSIDLSTADGLPSLPMHISWVRNGILVVGMDNETHVYSQWKMHPDEEQPSKESVFSDADAGKSAITKSASFLMPLNMSLSKSLSGLKLNASIASLSMLAEKKEKEKRKDSRSVEPPELPKSESFCSFRMMQECGLFEAAHLANPCLPQYHPKQLIELLNFGKIRRVKAILAHLLRCIGGYSHGGTGSVGEGRPRAMHGHNVSTASPKSPVDGIFAIPEEPQTDYVEISSIPPLPLYALLAADDDAPFSGVGDVSVTSANNQTTSNNENYNSLFNLELTTEDVLDDPFDASDPSASKPAAECDVAKIQSSRNSFGPTHASLLARHLIHTQLPGMSSLDQMYLLALAETVANTKMEFGSVDLTSKTEASVSEADENEMVMPEAIGDCGLRFLLAARHHVYLMNSLPMRQRAQLQQQGLSPAAYIWAFHSESEQELLDSLPCMHKGSPTWTELRQFGAGWWLRNVSTLTKCFEKLARDAFVASKDPLDAALFYLAMKKKNVLWGLFRSVDNTKMAQFFRNNFSEDRWRKAALKNAFALLGKQKFYCAAAFFLLGGAVKDAVEVCLTKLDDLQLAIVILRLYESDMEDAVPLSFKHLLYKEILGCDEDGQLQDICRASPDPFLRSMAYWILKDHSSALSTLLTPDSTFSRRIPNQKNERMEASGTNLSVFNFYNYLRTHPLLMRQHLATTAADKSQTVLLSGFSYGSAVSAGDKNVTYVDRITPVERRLYFMTAHEHFKNGCAMLALEVLNKLPEVVRLDSNVSNKSFDEAFASETKRTVAADTAAGSDRIAPAPETSSGFDWSIPVSSFMEEETLELRFDSSGEDEEEEGDGKGQVERRVSENALEELQGDGARIDVATTVANDKSTPGCDVMAQQLKFIACIKIIVNELATLATGFEVDGGQLRYQLYIWLEKEVEVLKRLCNYGSDVNPSAADKATDAGVSRHDDATFPSLKSGGSQSDAAGLMLHDAMLAEKSDFEAKVDRMARRKNWLKANEQLLRMLLSYAVLHGSCGGGLASMCMELLLLLQELQQERTRQQLMSPLPFPTTLPLLSASIASSKMAVASPIQHLQCMSQDLLHTIIELREPPSTDTMSSKVILLQNLSAALSACIYQCLCDSDRFVVSGDGVGVGMEGFTSTNVVYKDSYLMAGAQSRSRLSSTETLDLPTSLPAKWPGVSSLITLLNKRQDEEAPRLNILLTESLLSVYMSLLCYALAMFDAIILYRLVGHPLVESIWSVLFGGGLKKLVPASALADISRSSHRNSENSQPKSKASGVVLCPSVTPQCFQEDRPTYQERFVPPQMSIITYFMTKINSTDHPGIDYDSAASISSCDEEEEQEELIESSRRNEVGMNEHLNPKSYSWCLMRYAIIKHVDDSIKTFLPKIGIELSELPVLSPLIHGILRNLEQWEHCLRDELDKFPNPPSNYIPGCYVDSSGSNAVSIMKYSSLMDLANTPFISAHYSSRPAKRLWHYLVTRKHLQDVFIRYVFKKRTSASDVEMSKSPSSASSGETEPMKMIHKDQEVMTCFCINQVNLKCLVVATQKEVVEMDISRVLAPPSWISDDVDYDIEVIQNPINHPKKPEDFLVVRTPFDGRSSFGAGSPVPAASGAITGNVAKGFAIPGIASPNLSFYIVDRSRRLIRRLMKRPVSGVRRVAAHPHLPYYLTGSEDGCVRLWEWSHSENISEPRKPGAFPRSTKVTFNAQGNKFGVSDVEGAVCLWQVGLGLSMNKPYLSLRCHNKVTSDFAFIGSSSLLATCGQSTDNKNVCLWDTLLPKRKSLVHAFHCHNDGCPALVYAPQHQAIISGGKKGEVYIFDVRQRQLRQTFQAHDSAIKCMALDPAEECFVTGSADGDIKVWNLMVHSLMYTFTGEHSKGSSLFRNMSSGVTQVYLGHLGHLFSCGTDGSLKVHQMTHRRGIVNTWHA